MSKIDQMREALEFYADPDGDGYRVDVTDYGLSTEEGEIVRDGGKRARAALATVPDPTHTREGELEAALKPFAEAAGDCDYRDGTPALHEYPDASSLPELNDLTIGDLRRARTALNARGGA
jgi:hypothetical protein